jgi:hypothetical protein
MLLILFSGESVFAQVELSKETSKKEKKQKEKRELSEKDGATSIFLTTNWSFTNSRLETNDGLIGDSLGYRANETGLNTWSFGIGFRNRLHKNFVLEGGVSFMRNGESYSFVDTDTSYSYQTQYTYIAMPIRGMYSYGDKIELLVGGGIVPQMFVVYKQDIQWTTSNNTDGSESSKTQNNYEPFVISAVLNAGVQFKMSDSWSFLFLPEYKIELNTSFEKNSPYKHFARSLGFNFGLVVQL